MKLHMCKENPCLLMDKEYADILTNGFTTFYTNQDEHCVYCGNPIKAVPASKTTIFTCEECRKSTSGRCVKHNQQKKMHKKNWISER